MTFLRLSFVSLLVVSTMLNLFSPGVASAPLDTGLARRQAGVIECNINRAQIIVALAETISAVNNLASAGSSDPAIVCATNTTLSGLATANNGIETILQALLENETAPASGRLLVQQGVSVAQDALNSINSTDPGVISTLGVAQTELSIVETAGNNVVANCG